LISRGIENRSWTSEILSATVALSPVFRLSVEGVNRSSLADTEEEDEPLRIGSPLNKK
jgi:hypothetical protein